MTQGEAVTGDRPPRHGTGWWACVAVLLPLVAVAISVRASYPLGPSAVPQNGAGGVFLSSIAQVALVLGVAAFELLLMLGLVYAPWRRLREAGRAGAPVAQVSRRMALRLAALPVIVLLIQAAVLILVLRRRTGLPKGRVGLGAVPHLGQQVVPPGLSVSLPETTAIAAGLGLVVLVVVALVKRRGRRLAHPAAGSGSLLQSELASAIDESLGDLALGGDPRQAVIAAYERMERALAGVGLPPEAFETPLEYLERALHRLQASRAALTRLTDLFETARYSRRSVGPEMRSEAEAALAGLRAELGG